MSVWFLELPGGCVTQQLQRGEPEEQGINGALPVLLHPGLARTQGEQLMWEVWASLEVTDSWDPNWAH